MSSLADIQQQNANIAKQIAQLQKYAQTPNLPPDQVKAINSSIISMSSEISDNYDIASQNYAASQSATAQLQRATDIINQQASYTGSVVDGINSDTQNKQRQIEINNYYSEQYLDRTNIMKTIILFCIPLMILAILKNKGIINNTLFIILMMIIVIIAIIYLGKIFLMAISHDSNYYDQYDWNFNRSLAPPVDTSNPDGLSASINYGISSDTTTCDSAGSNSLFH